MASGYETLFVTRDGETCRREHGQRIRMCPSCRTVIVKSDIADKLLRFGFADPDALASSSLVCGWISGGRTRHALIEAEGEQYVLKSYRRGGALGFLNSNRYWNYRRFLQELEVAAAAQESGVSTAELLGLVLEPAGYGSIRAWMMSRYLPRVQPLYRFFGHERESGVFRTAGELVARMHEAGIDHPDLHLGNIVGVVDGDQPRAYMLDWDRAVRRDPGTWDYDNLLRLWRSVQKARKQGRLASTETGAAENNGNHGASIEGMFESPPALKAFMEGYMSERPANLGAVRDYFKRRALIFKLRTLFWRSEY